MPVFLLVSHNLFSVSLIVDINVIFLRVVLTSLNTLFNIMCWHSLAGQPPSNTPFSENDKVLMVLEDKVLKIHLLKVISLEIRE